MDSKLISVSRTIPASPSAVWQVVSDISSMGSRSPQCKKMIGFPPSSDPVHPDGITININRRGKYTFWITTARFLTVEPKKELSFLIPANHYLWTYRLEPAENGGTTVTLERLLADARPSLISSVFVKFFLGGDEAFTQEMAAGMQETLAKVEEQAMTLLYTS